MANLTDQYVQDFNGFKRFIIIGPSEIGIGYQKKCGFERFTFYAPGTIVIKNPLVGNRCAFTTCKLKYSCDTNETFTIFPLGDNGWDNCLKRSCFYKMKGIG